MSHSFDRSDMVLVAKKAIAKGDELCVTYLSECLDPRLSTTARRKLLTDRYNFVCSCERCGPGAVAVS